MVSGSIESAFSKISFKPAQCKIRDKVSLQRNSEPGDAQTRRKREVASEEDYYSFPIRETLQDDASPYSGQVSDLGSALLSSALDGHKVGRTKENTSKGCIAVQIRHLDEKIALLSEDDSLVKSIIARWAHKMALYSVYCNFQKPALICCLFQVLWASHQY